MSDAERTMADGLAMFLPGGSGEKRADQQRGERQQVRWEGADAPAMSCAT